MLTQFYDNEKNKDIDDNNFNSEKPCLKIW